MTQAYKRVLVGALLLGYIGLCAWIFTYIGKPFLAMLDEPGAFRDWIGTHGILGPLVFFLMLVLQVFVAVIPGEPFEIAAGYVFGGLWGTVLCVLAIALGQALVFLLIKRFGMRALEVFIPREKLASVRWIRQSGRSFRLLFILFFIPGTPKDILTYCAGLMEIDLSTFLIVTTIARLPSVVSSTIGGNALANGDYLFAVLLFLALSLVSILGLWIYTRVKRSVERGTHKKTGGLHDTNRLF